MRKTIMKAAWAVCWWAMAMSAQAANLLTNPAFAPSPDNYPDISAFGTYNKASPPGWTNVKATSSDNNGPFPNNYYSSRGGTPQPVPSYQGSNYFYDLGYSLGPLPGGVGDGISQTFATVPGRQYKLTFGFSSESNGVDASTDPTFVSEVGKDTLRVQVGDQDVKFDTDCRAGSLDYGKYIPSAYGQPGECASFQATWATKTVVFTATSTTTTLSFTIASVSTTVYTDGSVSNSANTPMIAMPVVEEIITGPILTVTKALGNPGRINAADQFTVRVNKKSDGALVSTANTTTTTGTTGVDPGTGTTGSMMLTSGVVYTVSEAMAANSVSSLAQYTAALACSNATSGGTDVTGVTQLGDLPALVTGDVVTCTITNTPKVPTIALSKALGVTGRVSVTDQFVVWIKDGSGSIKSASTNATTRGVDNLVDGGTGTTGVFRATVGTAYKLGEDMAAGSASSLTQYTASLSCTNSLLPANGGTNPANLAVNTNFSPVWGDAITCTLTNSAKTSPTVSGKVIIDTGAGSGIAHNAVQDGSELGHGGMLLQLTNCASTVYSAVTSQADGSFSIPLSGVPTGQAVCLVQSTPNPYQAVSVNVGDTAGTYAAGTGTGTTSSLTFTPAPNTSYRNLVLGLAPLSTLVSNGTQQTAPGGAVTYAHVYTAGSAGTVLFSQTDAPNPAGTPWVNVLYRDANCDSQLDGGDTPLNISVAVAAGERVCVLVRVIAPANAVNGASDSTTLTATETWAVPTTSPTSQVHVLKNTDVTLLSTSGLTLMKEARRVASCPATAAASLADTTQYSISSTASPGQYIEYRIRYANNTAAPLTAVQLYDSVPAYTNFRSGLCLTSPDRGFASPACTLRLSPSVGAASGSIQWALTDATGSAVSGLQPTDSGSVSFCVQVQF